MRRYENADTRRASTWVDRTEGAVIVCNSPDNTRKGAIVLDDSVVVVDADGRPANSVEELGAHRASVGGREQADKRRSE